MHWAEEYVGRPYGAERDCADLVREVLRERFGRDVDLPGVHAATVRARDEQMRLASETLADAVDRPQEGDAVLMRAVGRVRGVGHHVGVWCDVGCRGHVLHCMRGIGTCLHDLARLERAGLELEGFYRWR